MTHTDPSGPVPVTQADRPYSFGGVRYGHADMAIAQRAACAIVPLYGTGDHGEQAAAQHGRLWNDHPAVQAALRALHEAGFAEHQISDAARHRISSGSDILTEAVKPWASYHGDLPDYDHPFRPVYESGIQYAVELLAKVLGVTEYTPCDGTEEFDGDLGGTLMNIVLAAMPTDQDGDPIHPSDLPSALSTSGSDVVTVPSGEAERDLEILLMAHRRDGDWQDAEFDVLDRWRARRGEFGMDDWRWWWRTADDDQYREDFATREEALAAALVEEPAATIHLIEARVWADELNEGDDTIPFAASRNHEVIATAPTPTGEGA